MNFLGLSPEYATLQTASYCIFQVPYERTTSYKKGTRNGPRAILEASDHLEYYDEELGSEPCRSGIFTLPRLDFREECSEEECLNLIYRDVRALINPEKFVISLGGEHSISYPLVRAHAEHHPELTVLHLDAHADLREEYHGSRYNHACAMARVREVASVVSVGVRALSKPEMERISGENLPVWFAHEMRENPHWMIEVLDSLEGPVYLSIDVDFFDPSIMPATGTPEPGGFFWNETLRFLRMVFAEKQVVGADVVELLPTPGLHFCDYTVARLVYKMIGYREAARAK